MAENPKVDHNHAAKIKLIIDAAYAEMDKAALPISLKEEVCSFLDTASLILERWAVDVEDQTCVPTPPVVEEAPPPIIQVLAPEQG